MASVPTIETWLNQQLDLHPTRPATADFLSDQRPGGSAYVVGEAGLTNALHEIGYVMNDRDPDYVVLARAPTAEM